MIALIDPAFFVRGDPRSDEMAFVRDLAAILTLLRNGPASLVAVEDYWRPMAAELIQPLEQRFPSARQPLGELRKRAVGRVLPTVHGTHRVWGFKSMFDCPHTGLAPAWVDRMTSAAHRACLTGEPVILIARPVVGRNVVRHQTGHSRIDEVTRWRLYVQPGTATPAPIACIDRVRHLRQPWTARYDARLPGAEDGARYPFCPDPRWWKRDIHVVGTRESKPAFIDHSDRAWARPSTPGAGHHWDVYVSDVVEQERLGVAQLNIVEVGAPASEGTPGFIHHVPREKKQAVHDVGWSCT